ncbi:TolC family protein [Bacteroides sp. 214]|uniref:TolC family protein n=1 Tax=Bacteroides sp. 214 TaxID=2302935 RepID=UPI0013D8B3AD|nr:TolC family protein [Bacteroides sp. 214]NDW13213.1 TolC family protein [Bacteroides sp. 214]
MKKLLLAVVLPAISLSLSAQVYLDLDSCRSLAIANNKNLLIGNEKITAAHHERKAAATNYLPKISATGAYMRNQKEFSLLNDEQKSTLSNMGTILGNSPELAPLLNNLIDPLNGIGSALVEGLRTDTRNVYAGAITLTQPIYMGGKIRAYNKITKYAEELAHQQHNAELQEVILETDQAYWQVVSLVNKKKMAESYLQLLQKMDSDINKMIAEGVATKSDGLSVRVKLNEAEMTVTKVDDGLSLSRMLLCQLCGLNLSTPISLADESIEELPISSANSAFNIETVFASRPEVRALQLGQEIYKQKINVTRADHLPTVALMGNYIVSNPSMFNSFENKFRGMWNVGIMVQIPVWSWGEGTHKVKAAKAEARIARYNLEDAKEKIELQVNQAAFKVNEAAKKLVMATKNMEKAEENLRYANLGFREGVIATSNVLEAQTVWLSAHAEKIDAQIDVKLTEAYLKKSLGQLHTNE